MIDDSARVVSGALVEESENQPGSTELCLRKEMKDDAAQVVSAGVEENEVKRATKIYAIGTFEEDADDAVLSNPNSIVTEACILENGPSGCLCINHMFCVLRIVTNMSNGGF